VVEVKDDLTIACGSGSLLIKEVQLQDSRKMSAHDFVRGHPLAIGETLPS